MPHFYWTIFFLKDKRFMSGLFLKAKLAGVLFIGLAMKMMMMMVITELDYG
jgi:hypothetical protein